MAEKKINGRTYKVEPLGAKEAIRLLGRLTKVGGAAWDRLRKDIEDGAETMNVGMVIVTFVVELSRNNDVDDVVGLIEEICGYAQVKLDSGYSKIYFDEEFSGRLQDVHKVATFVLEENFSDFLSELGLTSSADTRKKAA